MATPRTSDRSRPRAGLLAAAGVGLLATVTGMAAGHFTASLLRPQSSPVLAVGSTVIDLTPTPVKEWAVANFGTADKPILIGSVVVVTLLLSAVAGILARRRYALGAGLLLLLVVLAGLAAVLRPTAGFLDAVPALVTAVVGLGVLTWLVRGLGAPRAGDAPPDDAASPADAPAAAPAGASRRGVLIGTGVLAAAAVALGVAGQAIVRVRTRIADIVLPKPVSSPAPLPTGLEVEYPGISKFRTPDAEFYRVDTNLTVPIVDQTSWTLTIDGDVEKEVTIDYEQLLAMDMVEKDITMTCVSNSVGGPYVGAGRWLGVPIKDILDLAGIEGTKADQILSTAFDGFTISTPLDVALDGRDMLVVVGLNGEVLSRERGFPVRLITPGIYGFVGGTKWLTKLTLTTFAAEQAYWTERKWSEQAPIKISSRIDTPKPLSSNDPGRLVVGGVAWAQTRGIAKVELRIDGGAWQEVQLGPDAGVDYWRQWYYEWDADEGQHSLTVRATADDGEVQTAARANPFPNGSSGWQDILVNVG